MSLVMQANCAMASIWNSPYLTGIQFHLKSTRTIEHFQKAFHQYLGTIELGPCVFYQFKGERCIDDTFLFVNVNIDDIAKFVLEMKKPSASSPIVDPTAPVQE